jgi:ribonuclease HI
MVYYSVAKGRTIGIFESWPECKKSIDGFEGAVFKKFDTKEDAEKFSKVGFGKSGFTAKSTTNSSSNNFIAKSNTSFTVKSTSTSSTAKNNNDTVERYQNVNFNSDSDSDSDKKVINTNAKKMKSNNTSVKMFTKKEEANIRANINFDSDSDSDSDNNTKSKPLALGRNWSKAPIDIPVKKEKLDKLDKLILSHNNSLKIQDYDSDDNEEYDINEIFKLKDTYKSSNLICKIEDLKTFKPDTIVYTDGSCINNGYPNAEAGIGVYFGVNDSRNVSKKIDSNKKSNNIAELTAIITAYKILEEEIKENKKIVIFSDSMYAIRCITIYGEKNEKLKWNKTIPNIELVKEAYELFKNKSNIKIIHIKAHTGLTDIHSLGNQEADRLANLAINPEANNLAINSKNDKSNLVKDESKTTTSKEKIYLDVPFAKKDEAKKLGCRWDPDKKKWYVFCSNASKATQPEGYILESNDSIFKQFKKISKEI